MKLAVLSRRLLSTEGVRDAAVFALITILGGGAAFAAVENGHQEHPVSAWDGVWWAITTVTTVGYGDFSPTTLGGRVIAIVVMVVGIGFVAIITAAAAERFMRSREAEAERAELRGQLDEVLRRLDRIERKS